MSATTRTAEIVADRLMDSLLAPSNPEQCVQDTMRLRDSCQACEGWAGSWQPYAFGVLAGAVVLIVFRSH